MIVSIGAGDKLGGKGLVRQIGFGAAPCLKWHAGENGPTRETQILEEAWVE